MADYYIKCTEKNSSGDIERVGYTSGLYSSVGNNRKTKSDVVNDIDNRGKDVKTAYKKGGSWTVGDDVHTVSGQYIRTDGNQIESDNLDSIGSC